MTSRRLVVVKNKNGQKTVELAYDKRSRSKHGEHPEGITGKSLLAYSGGKVR